MHTLQMLGSIGLTAADGRDVDALLRQPKHVALLAYLAMPQPGSWHRRDAVIGIFWPELDQARARNALRSALYTLRRHLPDGAIRSRGDDELSIDPAVLTTDIAEMMTALNDRQYATALGRYEGDFLPGLFIADAEGFDQWLEHHRNRAKAAALKAAALLADEREAAGDMAGAVDAMRRASELNPNDEALARRHIALLDRAGDRAQALAVYERFKDHVLGEFGTQPSAETSALASAVRAREQARAPSAGSARAVPIAAPPPNVADTSVAAPPNATSAATLPTGSAHLPVRPPPRHRRRWAIAAAVVAVGAIAFAAVRRESTAAAATTTTHRLVVLPMENETGDAKQDYVAAGIADGLARRLGALGPFTIRSGARSDWPAAVRHDYRTIGQQFGSTVLLRTTLSRVGDSLEVRAAVVDPASGGERQLGARSFSTARLRDVESALAADVAGGVFRVAQPSVPRQPERVVDPESYRLTMEGWHQLLTKRDVVRALPFFEQATTVDPSNARAWSGLSSAWSAELTQGFVPFDVGYDRTSAAASRALALDSLQGTALANLGYVRALRYRSLALGDELFRKAAAAEPANAEVFLIQSVLLRYAHQWDRATDAIRIARALDPLSVLYADREALVELCAGRPAVALRMYTADSALNPLHPLIRRGLIRSLARLGRYDDAIAVWRQQAITDHDSALAASLAGAHGAADFWAIRHRLAQPALRRIEEQGKHGWVAPEHVISATFEAGELERGFALLESGTPDPGGRMFHLPCLPAFDEVRGTPRYAAAAARYGALPLR